MKTKVKALIAITILIVAAGIIFACILSSQREAIRGLEARIEGLQSGNVPIKFMVRSRSAGRAVVAIKFFDAEPDAEDKEAFSELELELAGNEVALDFIVKKASFAGETLYIAFPFRVFGDMMKPEEGIPLFDYYSSPSMPYPRIYEASRYSRAEREMISSLFTEIKAGGMEAASWGSAIHDVKTLRSFEQGRVYKVVAHPKGGIEPLILETY